MYFSGFSGSIKDRKYNDSILEKKPFEQNGFSVVQTQKAHGENVNNQFGKNLVSVSAIDLPFILLFMFELNKIWNHRTRQRMLAQGNQKSRRKNSNPSLYQQLRYLIIEVRFFIALYLVCFPLHTYFSF